MKPNPDDDDDEKNEKKTKNGCGSEVIYFSRSIKMEESWKFFDYLHNQIPGNRPNEKLYGSTLEIASVSFGCERGFLLKIKQSKSS